MDSEWIPWHVCNAGFGALKSMGSLYTWTLASVSGFIPAMAWSKVIALNSALLNSLKLFKNSLSCRWDFSSAWNHSSGRWIWIRTQNRSKQRSNMIQYVPICSNKLPQPATSIRFILACLVIFHDHRQRAPQSQVMQGLWIHRSKDVKSQKMSKVESKDVKWIQMMSKV